MKIEYARIHICIISVTYIVKSYFSCLKIEIWHINFKNYNIINATIDAYQMGIKGKVLAMKNNIYHMSLK